MFSRFSVDPCKPRLKSPLIQILDTSFSGSENTGCFCGLRNDVQRLRN